MRLLVHFDPDVEVDFGAQNASKPPGPILHDTAQAYDHPTIVTDGSYAYAELNNEFDCDGPTLVLPPVFLVMVAVLVCAYGDLIDVVIGCVGTVVSLLWMLGLMGWFGFPDQETTIIAPVLIVAMSNDFGVHILTHFREQGGPSEAIRAALNRSTATVVVAFSLVTITAGIGFIANLTSPVYMIVVLGLSFLLSVFVLPSSQRLWAIGYRCNCLHSPIGFGK